MDPNLDFHQNDSGGWSWRVEYGGKSRRREGKVRDFPMSDRSNQGGEQYPPSLCIARGMHLLTRNYLYTHMQEHNHFRIETYEKGVGEEIAFATMAFTDFASRYKAYTHARARTYTHKPISLSLLRTRALCLTLTHTHIHTNSCSYTQGWRGWRRPAGGCNHWGMIHVRWWFLWSVMIRLKGWAKSSWLERQEERVKTKETHQPHSYGLLFRRLFLRLKTLQTTLALRFQIESHPHTVRTTKAPALYN